MSPGPRAVRAAGPTSLHWSPVCVIARFVPGNSLMKRFICAAAVLAVALAGAARSEEKPTAEQLTKDVIRLQNELVKELEAVKDREAARKAKPKVDDLQEKVKK